MRNSAQLKETKVASNRNPIDVHVGSRLRQRRTLLGMSQDKLAESLNITFQQVQKYENGINRIGASRLFQVCKVLGVPISFFFDEYQPTESDGLTMQVAETNTSLADDIMQQKETLNLVRSYYAIPDANVRKKVLEMIKVLTPED